MRRLQAIELPVGVLVHHVPLGLEAREGVERFADFLGFDRDGEFAGDVPIAVRFFEDERILGVAKANPVHLGGVEPSPNGAIAIFVENLFGQIGIEREYQIAFDQFGIAALPFAVSHSFG